MVVSPQHKAECDKAAHTILSCKNRYVGMSKETTVPWFVIGMIDIMEAGGGCRRHLHNGDPLSHRTVNVPRGRLPAPHEPPFTWEQSAKDALALDGLDKVTDWSIERLCYELEKYNGFGYRAHGINSPYLWSYSDQYHSGKFVRDGVFSRSAVSEQAGAMPIFKSLMALDQSVTFDVKRDDKPAAPAAPQPAAPAEPKADVVPDPTSLWQDVEQHIASFIQWPKAGS